VFSGLSSWRAQTSFSLQISVPARAFQGEGGGNVKIERDSNTFARLLDAKSPLSKRDIICGYMKMLFGAMAIKLTATVSLIAGRLICNKQSDTSSFSKENSLTPLHPPINTFGFCVTIVTKMLRSQRCIKHQTPSVIFMTTQTSSKCKRSTLSCSDQLLLFKECEKICMQYVHGPRGLICIYNAGYVDFTRSYYPVSCMCSTEAKREGACLVISSQY
jgi:hypothetical protein